MLATEHHNASRKLSHQVDEDEENAADRSTIPGGTDVVSLLSPLEPHSNAVLKKCTDETETRYVR